MVLELDRLYFGYGSNMLIEQMALRCPGSVPIGICVLHDYSFLINRRGWATIKPDEGKQVMGVLWSINSEHEKTLDDCEGVHTGGYYREWVTVETSKGVFDDVLVYIDPIYEIGPPNTGYLGKILKGARQFDIPSVYIEELKSWG